MNLSVEIFVFLFLMGTMAYAKDSSNISPLSVNLFLKILCCLSTIQDVWHHCCIDYFYSTIEEDIIILMTKKYKFMIMTYPRVWINFYGQQSWTSRKANCCTYGGWWGNIWLQMTPPSAHSLHGAHQQQEWSLLNAQEGT